MTAGLFTMPEVVVPVGKHGFNLRDYQAQDVDATFSAFDSGRKAVVIRWATGLGKSLLFAEYARRMMDKGRVLIIVDAGSLAVDLYKTLKKHIGYHVGLYTGRMKDAWQTSRVVVALKQMLCAGEETDKNYRQFDPTQFAAIGVDECETSIADGYSEMLRYFTEGNPSIRIAAASATPFRSDGRAMGELYDHVEPAPGPLNRNMPWGRDNGWLVPWRQGFVRVSLDFSTLKLRKDDAGEKDYTDAQLTELLQAEEPLIELAKGIHAAANGEPSVVVCPGGDDCIVARRVADYLNAELHGCAEAVYGKLGTRADDLMDAFGRGDYPYITSVNKLWKGFDVARIRHVFMCRKTRSRRLGEQTAGRGARPALGVREALNEATSAEQRRGIITASDKPFFTFWDVVGLHPSVKDFGIADLELTLEGEEVVQRVKRRMHKNLDEQHDPQEAIRAAKDEIALEKRVAEERERQRRSRVQIRADVQLEVTDDIRISGGTARVGNMASQKQVDLCIALGVTPDKARAFSSGKAHATIDKLKRVGKRPDYSRVRNAGVALFDMPPGPWQRERIGKLDPSAAVPATANEARRLISELEARRRAVPA